MRGKTHLALASALAIATATTAMAAERTPEREALRRQCTSDYLTYCGNLDPDGNEVQACFRRNMSSMSRGCQAAVVAFQRPGRRNQANAD